MDDLYEKIVEFRKAVEIEILKKVLERDYPQKTYDNVQKELSKLLNQ